MIWFGVTERGFGVQIFPLLVQAQLELERTLTLNEVPHDLQMELQFLGNKKPGSVWRCRLAKLESFGGCAELEPLFLNKLNLLQDPFKLEPTPEETNQALFEARCGRRNGRALVVFGVSSAGEAGVRQYDDDPNLDVPEDEQETGFIWDS